MNNEQLLMEEAIKAENRRECELASIEDGASWCEGEEGWGVIEEDI